MKEPFALNTHYFKRLILSALFCFLFPTCGYSELNVFAGAGNAYPWGHRGEFEPTTHLMYRAGLDYELGQISYFKVQLGGSISRFEIEWEGQQSLNRWKYYLAGLHVGLAKTVFPSKRWGNRLGISLNSKWVPIFILFDDDEEFLVSNANDNGMTDIDIYIRQNLGPIYIRGFYTYPVNELISQGNLKINTAGIDLLFPIFKRL